MSSAKVKPLTEGLYVLPESLSGKPYLTGSKCGSCGEIYFPKKVKDYCIHCQQAGLSDVRLSREGTIAAFTVSEQAPSGGFYRGQVPYAYGFVDLPEGVRIITQFSGKFESLKIGKKVELVIENIAKNKAGEDIVSYMFK